MWPFKKQSTPARPVDMTAQMTDRIDRYASRLTVRICNTGEWAAVGRGTIGWGATRDDAVLQHMARARKLFPGDHLRPRPLRPRLVWASDTQAWCAIARGKCAEGPTPRLAGARLAMLLGETK